MTRRFLKLLFSNFLVDCVAFLFFGGFVVFYFKYVWIPAAFIILILAAIQASNEITEKLNKEINDTIAKKELVEAEALRRIGKVQAEAASRVEQAENDSNLWKKSLIEKSSGFSSLINLIEEYEQTKDAKLETFLKTKSHPALTSAEVVKEEARRRRFAESESKKIKAIIEYYETIAPFLLDFKDEVAGIESEDSFRDYSEEERIDPAVAYLAKEEFRKLPSVERNQMALDRFWSRPKSKWLLGRMYERYVGYIYENDGYEVEFTGIFKGYEDLGRDLICRKGKDLVIIQCKNWSQFKTIYEKHIFQFFGTVFQYRDENKNDKVRAIFYTTTQLSDLSRRFAEELGIELKEKFKFDNNYPSIKCNISRVDGEKIYHLPFDQQYDKVRIEKHLREFYCLTVKEAENKGFRRAFRWHGEVTNA